MSSACAFGRAFFLFAALAASAAPAATAEVRPPLLALAMMEPGLWRLRSEGEPTRAICVADAQVLIQLRHKTNVQRRLVIANEK